jgi:hypothetical protein
VDDGIAAVEGLRQGFRVEPVGDSRIQLEPGRPGEARDAADDRPDLGEPAEVEDLDEPAAHEAVRAEDADPHCAFPARRCADVPSRSLSHGMGRRVLFR